MPVNWKHFENRLIQYVKNRQAKNEDELAQRIVDEYHNEIGSGINQYNERVIDVNKNGFARSLKSGFKIAKVTLNEKQAQGAIKTYFAIGVMTYWTGGKLGLVPPPPGASSVVTNIVNNPGRPPVLLVGNTDDAELMIRSISTQLQIHATTIAGITTANVNGSPTSFPWVGIK